MRTNAKPVTRGNPFKRLVVPARLVFPGNPGQAAAAAATGVFWRIVEVILHIGAHRTVTTNFLTMPGLNRNNLAKTGIAVSSPPDTRAGLFDKLVCHPVQIAAARFSAAEASLIRLHPCLDKTEAEGMMRLLFGEENMIGSMNEVLSARRPAGGAGGRHWPNPTPGNARMRDAWTPRHNMQGRKQDRDRQD